GFTQRHRDYVLEQSSILSWSSSNFASAFEISKGGSSDISVGDCVITETGSLVGMVSSITATTATVTTILDTTVTVGAFVYSDGEDCVAEGEFSQIRKGLLRLSYYEGDGMLASGEAVYTSGVGGICPRGLLIGKIDGYISSAGGLDDYYTIKPEADFSSMNYVYIITDFEVSE
ncbi:MAG: rod shape-determining protein MreC, partial [Oscillospiraceae bacterium]|nr:rod shape-determining protein MreC [Oscillospiraceae bacterium]